MKVATMLRLACPFVKTNRNAAIVEQPEATSGIRDGSQAKPPAGNITGRSTTITWLMLSMAADSIHGTSANAHNIVQDDVAAELQQCVAV